MCVISLLMVLSRGCWLCLYQGVSSMRVYQKEQITVCWPVPVCAKAPLWEPLRLGGVKEGEASYGEQEVWPADQGYNDSQEKEFGEALECRLRAS